MQKIAEVFNLYKHLKSTNPESIFYYFKLFNFSKLVPYQKFNIKAEISKVLLLKDGRILACFDNNVVFLKKDSNNKYVEESRHKVFEPGKDQYFIQLVQLDNGNILYLKYALNNDNYFTLGIMNLKCETLFTVNISSKTRVRVLPKSRVVINDFSANTISLLE